MNQSSVTPPPDLSKQSSVNASINMAPTKEEKPAMSAFERRRLENIAANQAMLKDLSNSAEKIIPRAVSKPPKPAAPRKKAAPVKKEAPRPTRTSSRLAGLQADSETAKRKAEEEEAFVKESVQAKKQRIAGDINLNDVADGKIGAKLDDFLSGVMRGAAPNLRTFTEDDVKETTDEGLKLLREKMSSLELYDEYPPNCESFKVPETFQTDKNFQPSKSHQNEYMLLDSIQQKTSL